MCQVSSETALFPSTNIPLEAVATDSFSSTGAWFSSHWNQLDFFPFVLLWTSWTSCSWKPAVPTGACLPELDLVQCSSAGHCYSHTTAVPPQLKGISLKNPNLGNLWGWFCSGAMNDMRTTCAEVLGQPGCLGSCRALPWKQHSHWHCPDRLNHGSGAGSCNLPGEVGLEAHYSPFVNCQQEAVTLAGHLNNPLKNKIKWHCWSITGHSASRLLALAFAFLVPSYKAGFCWFHSQLLVSSHSQECLTTHSRMWEICCIKTAIKVKENKACENKQAAPLTGNPT